MQMLCLCISQAPTVKKSSPALKKPVRARATSSYSLLRLWVQIALFAYPGSHHKQLPARAGTVLTTARVCRWSGGRSVPWQWVEANVHINQHYGAAATCTMCWKGRSISRPEVYYILIGVRLFLLRGREGSHGQSCAMASLNAELKGQM